MNNKFKRFLAIACGVLSVFALGAFAACDDPTPGPAPTPGPGDDPIGGTDPVTYISVTLKESVVTTDATEGVTINGTTVTITAPGEYRFTGKLNDGNIIVDIDKTEKIELILAGVTITSKTTAPIYVKNSDKATIVLEDGTTNVLTDAASYVFGTNALGELKTKPNACIYSEDDLVIKGGGSLTVNANFNNGIGTKNDLRIKGGNITVYAQNNALKGNDSVEITGGTINIRQCDDGIKADTDDDITKGFVYIENATVSIKATDDGIVAETKITVKPTAKVSFNVAGSRYKCTTGIIETE